MMTTTMRHCETCGQQMLPTDYWQRKAQEIENAAYERAAEICDTWSGYKTYQGDAQGACDDCAAAIRALKK